MTKPSEKSKELRDIEDRAKARESNVKLRTLTGTDLDTLVLASAAIAAAYTERIGIFALDSTVYGNFRVSGVGVPAKGAWFLSESGAAKIMTEEHAPKETKMIRVLLERIYDGDSVTAVAQEGVKP